MAKSPAGSSPPRPVPVRPSRAPAARKPAPPPPPPPPAPKPARRAAPVPVAAPAPGLPRAISDANGNPVAVPAVPLPAVAAVGPDEGGSDSQGVPFVRMLNRAGLVVGVPAMFVPERLCEGYSFIVREPCVPRDRGNPEVCDAVHYDPSFVAEPRRHGAPSTIVDANVLWLSEMNADAVAYRLSAPWLLWQHQVLVQTALLRPAGSAETIKSM